MKHILVVDNYDSFTFNLVHYIEARGDVQVDVVRNDAIRIEQAALYESIVLSPGPGLPVEAGKLMNLIAELAPSKKILGVCLGHQAIGEVFGAQLKNLEQVYHGQSMQLNVLDNEDQLFVGLPDAFHVGRYHSWVIDKDTLPETLRATAVDENGEVMAIRHLTHNLCGVQFHPESVLTNHGRQIIDNWLYSS
jgi:anthranilate synthase component 2